MKDGMKEMKYVKSKDDTCNELECYQDFLCCQFYKHEHYEEMDPRSNQSGQNLPYKYKEIKD